MAIKFNKILIVRLSAIGDVINTIPALVILRQNFPRAFIGWVVESKAKGLLEPYLQNRHLDRIFVFQRSSKKISGTLGLASELQSENFDIAIDFQGNLKSGLVTSFSKAETRVGMKPAKEANSLFTNHKIKLPKRPINRVERNIFLLNELGLDTSLLEWDQIPMPFTKQDEQYILKQLSNFNLQIENSKLVVLHPGTSDFGAFKRWPAENYAQLADGLTERFKVTCVISWGGKASASAQSRSVHSEGELELAQSIADRMKHKPIIIEHALTLCQSAALYKSAALFIGSDSAPLHLANLVGTPVIGLYGPKDPAIYGPYRLNPKSEIRNPKFSLVVRKDLPCSPCTKRKCGQPICMESITVDEVLEAASGILKRP